MPIIKNPLTIVQGGGPAPTPVPVEEKDINFYDYDGTLVESWTLAELANKTALPSGPTHTGLSFDGWNWTLAELQAQSTPMDVGAIFNTTDGKTHLFVDVDAGHLTPNLAIGLNGTAVIDWGDGTSVTTLTGSDADTSQNSYHTYSQAGEYEVTIDITGTAKIRGNTNYVTFFWKGEALQNAVTAKNVNYATQLKKIYIGSNVTALWSLNFASGLEVITIPRSVSIDDSTIGMLGPTFQNCENLKFVAIPPESTATALQHDTFRNCGSLQRVSMPPTMRWQASTGGRGPFNRCGGLTRVCFSTSVSQTMPNRMFFLTPIKEIYGLSSVTTMGIYLFSDPTFGLFSSVAELDFTGATGVPTLDQYALASSLIGTEGSLIKVPTALETSWKAAQYWSDYASYIVGV